MKASILTIGCSSEKPYHMPCIENDAKWVAEQYRLVAKRFIDYKKYPLHQWTVCDPLVGQVISTGIISNALVNMPVNPTMVLYISSHGFKQKIDGKVEFCIWLGNKKNWTTFRNLVQAVNDICEQEPTIKRFQIILDSCFSGAAKRTIRNTKSMATKTKPKDILFSVSKHIEPFGKVVGMPRKKINVHKKVSILTSCKSNQTSFGSFSPDDFAPITTEGHSLSTECFYTSMNWFYSYGAGLDLEIAGQIIKPRTNYAVKHFAQYRVAHIIKTIGMAEYREWYPRTVISQFTSTGNFIMY